MVGGGPGLGVTGRAAHPVGDQSPRDLAGSRRLIRLGSEVVRKVGDGLGEAGTPVVVALSGGADSAVLTWAVRQDDRDARAVHVHHGWPASDRLEGAAAAVADRLGIDLDTVRISTSGPGSPEAAARSARYAALEESIRPGELIVTAHTSTDQAETVLGNLMWGSGLDGLRGVHRRRNGIVRPLLDVSRDETRELARLLGLPFVDDPANHDLSFRRVRIRRVLAAWERSLAPGITDRLAGLAGLVRADLAYLDEMSSGVNIEERDGGMVRIPAPVLRTIPPALAARAVRRALRAVHGGHPGSRRDVEAVLGTARDGAARCLTGGRPVIRTGTHVRIGGGSGQSDPPVRWDPDRTVRWGDWTWQAQEGVGRPEAYPLSPWRQVFDSGYITGREVVIRRVMAGDRIAMRAGHKRAPDALAEAGVPGEDRDTWPLLEVDGRVIWIPGVRRAYLGWVTGDTMGHVLVSVDREEKWKPLAY